MPSIIVGDEVISVGQLDNSRFAISLESPRWPPVRNQRGTKYVFMMPAEAEMIAHQILSAVAEQRARTERIRMNESRDPEVRLDNAFSTALTRIDEPRRQRTKRATKRRAKPQRRTRGWQKKRRKK